MKDQNSNYKVTIETTSNHCSIGEKVGNQMIDQKQIPVLSCEGSCIRGEIARQAANMMAKEGGYGRACHGEIISVPNSAMAKWANKAEKIVVIDGCFLHCHGRILKNLFNNDQLAIFDALSYYKKYTDIMDSDDIPEKERLETAKLVLNRVLEKIQQIPDSNCIESAENCTSCCIE